MDSTGRLTLVPFDTTTASSRGSWDPHPLLTEQDRKRKAAQRIGTTYVYDWPETFEVCVKELWAQAIRRRSDVPGLDKACPKHTVQATEFVISEGALKAKPISDGNNDAGMVCWEFNVFLPTRYDLKTGTVVPKKIVVIANDISYQSGSFAIEEDKVFHAAAKWAETEGLPLIYLAANSGARIGMAQEVKDVYKVMFKDEDAPEKGFEYLYVDEADYQRLSARSLNAEPVPHPRTGATVYRLKDVIGAKEGLGVENLSGSGLIAGQMSACYATVPTLSLASGRSVGIGAYLNRLGRRVVQVTGAPMILTGAAALNKLLGKEVYTSNNQLGGTPVMSPNGVTHWEVNDDLEGCKCIIHWVDMMPEEFASDAKRVPALQEPHFQIIADPWDRDIHYCPVEGEISDPRFLITGYMKDGVLQRGLFDEDSWHETMSKWATTVVSGRAKLGGYPVGIICVETRTQEKILPADPADASSTASVRSQAGNVWFPDSARKTADSIQDFQKEGLPCFILANWRGFSGGQRDMFDEVLKFGASIVDNLREYDQPVFVYIPPFGDLRGGAWVVIDYNINPDCIEMYADETSHAGVLEPSGLIEVKYRDSEIVQTMHRLDPTCAALKKQMTGYNAQAKAEAQGKLKSREEALGPIYKSIATQLANLHDTPGRMLAKGSIQGIVQWQNARRFFFWRLRRRLHEFHVIRQLQQADPQVTQQEGRAQLQAWAPAGLEDAAFVKWCEENEGSVADKVKAIWAESKAKEWAETLAGPEGLAVLMKVLKTYRQNGGDLADVQKLLSESC
uniref:CoA carboxyltransferase C-terminal domain-containing protein n=1 Tax=Eutreptiella gymnastica TaxID=73025 RepID=A0A7S4CEA8_9EUGL